MKSSYISLRPIRFFFYIVFVFSILQLTAQDSILINLTLEDCSLGEYLIGPDNIPSIPGCPTDTYTILDSDGDLVPNPIPLDDFLCQEYYTVYLGADTIAECSFVLCLMDNNPPEVEIQVVNGMSLQQYLNGSRPIPLPLVEDCSWTAIEYSDELKSICEILFLERTWTVFDTCLNFTEATQVIELHNPYSCNLIPRPPLRMGIPTLIKSKIKTAFPFEDLQFNWSVQAPAGILLL